MWQGFSHQKCPGRKALRLRIIEEWFDAICTDFPNCSMLVSNCILLVLLLLILLGFFSRVLAWRVILILLESLQIMVVDVIHCHCVN